MAFNDIEKKRIEKSLDGFLAKRRPPVHVRPDLDIGHRLSEQSVEIIEIRPQWDDRTIIREYPVANATYIRTQDLWKVFWKRADLEWHGYEPALTVASIDEFLTVVDQDKHACFFG